MKVDNAIILAAGTSSRFAPISFERHKALIEVRGEILIERQIRQLLEAGVPDIYVVIGYKAEQFEYLKKKYGVKLLFNSDYAKRNNNASIWTAKEVIRNSYICSSDNYFRENPFEKEVDGAYYATVFSEGPTREWCVTEKEGFIDSVNIGGEEAWYMLGHVFWDEAFSTKFIRLLEEEYFFPETVDKLWEEIYSEHIEEFKLKIKKYPSDYIYEFDTLDELRKFDSSYVQNSRSRIIKNIAKLLKVRESEIMRVEVCKGKDNRAEGFSFFCNGSKYLYNYEKMFFEEEEF